MRTHITKALILCASLLAAGCAPALYHVQVDARAAPSMPPTARVSVVAATRADPSLGPEVKQKIEALLKQRGFVVVEPASAADTVDLVVMAVFGVGSPSAEYAGTPVAPLAAELREIPETHAAQARWLIVAVARPKDLGAGIRMTSVPWLWHATTYCTDAQGDLDRTINYLLVPTFEWFGKSTGARVNTAINQYDPRVRVLDAPPD